MHVRARCVHCAASNGEVYQGRFGPWRIEQQDVVEVWGYRAGLSVAALGASHADGI